jgi:serine/threonine-protein kinase
MQESLAGRVLAGRFAIESLIGSGAMGAVYRARHVGLDKLVAVKVLHRDAASNPTFSERLRREAKAASRLDHPNSVRVIDFGQEPDGLLYIAMELLDGVDLQSLLELEGPLAEGRIVSLLSQVLAALDAAHKLGIVHRDLKPANIMIVRGVDEEGQPREMVKVCDFGIAKTPDATQTSGEAASLTTEGILLGTPSYMSPEQCRGEALDPRADIYSLGIVLYELLVGAVPFLADNVLDVLVKQVSEEPVPPSHRRPGISAHLEHVCLTAMSKKRDKRYASALEMRTALREAPGLDLRALGPASGHHPAASGDKDAATLAIELSRLRSGPPSPPIEDPAKRTTEGMARDKSRPPRRGSLAAALVGFGALAAAAAFVVRGRSRNEAMLASATAVSSAPAVEATAAAPAPAPTRAFTEILTARPEPAPPALRTPRGKKAGTGAAAAPATGQPATPEVAAAAEPPRSPEVVVGAEDPPRPASGPALAPLPAALPVLPPFEPSKGVVSWTVSDAGGGATVTSVGRSIARAASGWQQCYQAGLAARGQRVEGSGSLRLRCDDQGRIVSATLTGLDLPDVAACVRTRTMGVTIPNADTGEAWAAIALTFKVGP